MSMWRSSEQKAAVIAAAKKRRMITDQPSKTPETRALAPTGATLTTESTKDSGDGIFVIPGAPIGKPRMTQRDKWKKRPSVMRYRAWADGARAAAQGHMPADPITLSWTAYLPVPASWSKKKAASLAGCLHRQKPDRDNIDKAILDALFASDCGIAGGTLVKRWDDGRGPRIEIRITTL